MWDVFSDEQAAAFVHAALRRGLDLGAICRDLVAQAAVRGSRDDKSAVLVRRRPSAAAQQQQHEGRSMQAAGKVGGGY